ncbi:esterase family protein [Pendulispora rubella]|uniref:Esterase family protein n=1 Tax=Pendulispora rubella TaxID=2741070 RepID=A0ABZ2L8T5_9BACT
MLSLSAAVLTAAPSAAPSPSAPPPFAWDDGEGIHVVSSTQLDPRQYALAVQSAALGRTVNVRVLLPADYVNAPAARYPVLYLFHGTSGRASDWVTFGEAAQTTAGLPWIVVMPDSGFDGDGGGWFTDWWDSNTVEGPSRWETFHISQLVPWIDHNLRTKRERHGRAIAGLSQGGFGAYSYAARHPDMFGAAASFSGAPDIDSNLLTAVIAELVITTTAVVLDHVQPFAMFGPRLTNEINWQGHDPATLARNLRWTNMWLYTAAGVPGPAEPPNPASTLIEQLTHASTLSFHDRLGSLGIASHFHDGLVGTHSWPYWTQYLRQFAGELAPMFAQPPAPPTTISYESIDPSWSQWGWSVSLQRDTAQQWSSLSNADAHGFVLTGAGTATVVTPALYPPASTWTVTTTGACGNGSARIEADAAGRLHVTLPQGPLPFSATTVTIHG